MKPPFLPFILILALTGYLHAEFREFTDSKGRTLVAEMVRANAKKVWVRPKAGRVVTIERATLSESDQEFVKTWLADQVPDVVVSPDFDRGISKKRGSYSSSAKQTYAMQVEVKNYSATKALEESEVIYYLIGRSVEDREKYKVLSRQVAELTLEPGKTKKVPFKDIVNVFSDHDEARVKGHRGIGYVLHIRRKRDSRLVHLSTPSASLDGVKEAITALSQGDETGKDFIKAKEKPEPEMVEKEEKKEKKPPVITIK